MTTRKMGIKITTMLYIILHRRDKTLDLIPSPLRSPPKKKYQLESLQKFVKHADQKGFLGATFLRT